MSFEIIHIGPFAFEWSPDFVLLKQILEDNKITYTVFGKHNMNYEGDSNSGVKISVYAKDISRLKALIENSDSENLRQVINDIN